MAVSAGSRPGLCTPGHSRGRINSYADRGLVALLPMRTMGRVSRRLPIGGVFAAVRGRRKGGRRAGDLAILAAERIACGSVG